jgi:Rax2 C-terminal beta propeller domain/Secretion system C-terminal sorting domain
MTSFTRRLSSMSGPVEFLTVLILLSVTPTVFAQHRGTIRDVLNPDGSVRTSAKAGSYDAAGYRMSVGRDGTPTFTATLPNPDDKNWDPSFYPSGVSGDSYFQDPFLGYVATAADCGDTSLIVGGSFNAAGQVLANGIAGYNLNTGLWYALDTVSSDRGVSGNAAVVNSIVVAGDRVYIGGSFSSAGGVAANNIAVYNIGSRTWAAVGTGPANGVDSAVNSMVYVSGALYVGGRFTHAGGIPASRIAGWDGTVWRAVGTGFDSTVQTLASGSGILYAGGLFRKAGADTTRFIARWDGIEWSRVGVSDTDIAGTGVNAILPAGSSVYVGGMFSEASGIVVNGLAKWDGGSWSAVGSGVIGSVSGLAFFRNKLYVCGDFTNAGIIRVNNIAAFDTSAYSWSALTDGTDIGTGSASSGGDQSGVLSAVVADGKLYVTGEFSMAGGMSAFGIAGWDGTSWWKLGASSNSPGGTVLALALSGTNLYVGGSFRNVGSVPANNIAVFNTVTHAWSALGAGSGNGVGVDSGICQVAAIAISGSDVYVGGNFTEAGGLPANNIAMWDGTKWSSLGTPPNDGIDNSVYALALSGTDLYVGGLFANAGGNTANNVAMWNGTSWAPVGSGVDNSVASIAVGTGEIYFGGAFTHAGGNPASYVASWDGTNWSSLGSPTNGTDGIVFSVATSGDTLFAAGAFNNAGGSASPYLAKWDTHQWTSFPESLNGIASPIGVYGRNLFVGGNFTKVGTVDAGHAFEWNLDGGTVTTFGDGVNEGPAAIVSTGADVYMAGGFDIAGNKPSFNFARYNPNGLAAVRAGTSPATSFTLDQNYPNPFNPTTMINYRLPMNSHVTLKVYDVLGREVAILVDARQPAGAYTVQFDGSRYASGAYFYRLQAGGFMLTGKMLLVK